MKDMKSRPNGPVSVIYVIVQLGVVLCALAYGWGSLGDLLRDPTRAGLVVAMSLGSLTVLATGVALEPDSTKLRADILRLLPTLALAALYFGLLPRWDRLAWFIFLPGTEVRYTGLLLFMTGTGIRTRGYLARKDRISLNGLVPAPDPRVLVTTGLYQRMRYPQYLGLWLQALGYALVFRSWLGFVASLTLAWPLIIRMNAEDRDLARIHGEKFRSWARRSWRALPGIF